jgi:endoglucanase
MRNVLLMLAMAILAANAASGEPSNPAPGLPACDVQTGVPPSRLAMLARGFNLPGWLEGSTPRQPDLAVLASLNVRGFTHIRLPVGAEGLMEAFSSRGDVARHLGDLDVAISALTRLG